MWILVRNDYGKNSGWGEIVDQDPGCQIDGITALGSCPLSRFKVKVQGAQPVPSDGLSKGIFVMARVTCHKQLKQLYVTSN